MSDSDNPNQKNHTSSKTNGSNEVTSTESQRSSQVQDEASEDHQEQTQLEHAIAHAQRGLKSDVQVLIEAIAKGEVYIPLAEDMPDTPENEELDIGEGISFRPHMLLDPEHQPYAVCFTRPDFVATIQEEMQWKTSDDELKFVRGPVALALDLGQADADGQSVQGIVINPASEMELVLTRQEVGSILQGQALPLVGYVENLPPGLEEETIEIEGADEPPAALLEALRKSESEINDLVKVEVKTTFNPERDREPHLTLYLTVLSDDPEDRQAIAEDIMDETVQLLPEPGYCDIVFVEPAN